MGSAGAAGKPADEARQIGWNPVFAGSRAVARELHLAAHIVYVANETVFPLARAADP
jgi:hypothetical protein